MLSGGLVLSPLTGRKGVVVRSIINFTTAAWYQIDNFAQKNVKISLFCIIIFFLGRTHHFESKQYKMEICGYQANASKISNSKSEFATNSLFINNTFFCVYIVCIKTKISVR